MARITKAELEKLVEQLKEEKAALVEELKILKDKTVRKHNERGAGRKPLPDDIVKYILKLSEKGYSIRYISTAAKVSVGAVHKIIKDSQINK